MKIKSNFVDIENKKIYPVELKIKDKKIESIKKIDENCDTFILAGFIDSHIHIESSMLIPSEFSKLALRHGSVATVSDPHEIANVLGIDGVEFMIENSKDSGMKIYFGASPCIPATPFETSGATLNVDDIEKLLKKDDIYYLSEVMNFPAIINDDKEMLKKISLAKKYNKPIDGHSPALSGEALTKYIDVGISTDHEAFTLEEAKEKLQKNMKIQIREGSAAKNYEQLHHLIDEYYENLMFCSDDKHPNDLVKGHINELVKRAIKDGHDIFKVLQIASINPIKHYNLDVGYLNVGDNADFIEVKDLTNFSILRTFINGKAIFDNGILNLKSKNITPPNNFNIDIKDKSQYQLKKNCLSYKVIDTLQNQLITKELDRKLTIKNGIVQPNIDEDILIISVTNRYKNSEPSLSFVRGFGLKYGAIASSVAHDSHNIIAVGVDAKNVQTAVNKIIQTKGGVVCVKDDIVKHLPLEVAGLMSSNDAFEVAKKYEEIDNFAKQELKSTLQAPFMSLSFMALLVIPDIKLSDKGLFNGNSFQFIDKC